MQIVLGSQSPRRKEVLQYFSLPFIQASPSFEEESIEFQGDPEQYVCDIARGKAASLLHRFPQAIIITADTTVVCEGKVYNKPKDEQEACLVLSHLVGRWHTVYTGVTVRQGHTEFFQAEGSRVLFNGLSFKQIQHYIAHSRWEDKAGGYSILMAGGLLVRKIDGCYYNITGLPLNALESLLKNFHIELWDYL